MNLEVVKNAVTSRVSRQILVGRKHSPKILFGAGVVGMFGTVVLACNATLKLEDTLKEIERKRRYGKQDGRHQAAVTVSGMGKVAKLYLPAAGLGVASVAALTGSHVILTNRNTSLMAAYAALDRGFNEYRARVREELGDEKELELRHGIETKEVDIHDTESGTVHNYKVKDMPHGVSIYARFFDETSTSWKKTPSYNQMFVRTQQDWANEKLRANGHLFLNEVYDMLGLERSREGAVVGWVMNGKGDNYVDFGVFQGNSFMGNEFVIGNERSILLDFNVDGVIWDKI